MNENKILQSRLHSCLKSIVDLEEQLNILSDSSFFNEEIEVMKNFLGNISSYNLTENDVARIENATNNFFSELENILKLYSASLYSQRTRLQ